jgi:hypothetical protein
MKRLLVLFLFVAFASMNLYSQESEEARTKEQDPQELEQKKTIDPDAKKGWSFGVLPTITYNSDLGFQYGGLIDLYYYGDGTVYPKYLERYYLEISKFTKGSGINRFSMESNRIFKNRTVFIDVNYQPDEQFDFLGGNGYETMYNTAWIDPEDPNYKSRMFYKNQTKRLKAKLDVLHPMGDNWFWVSGIEYYNYSVNTLDSKKFNDGRDADDMITPTDSLPGLWDRFKEWGIIDAKNVDGGSFTGLKLGVMYDSRNNWTLATEGMWSEATLIYAPKWLGTSGTSFVKLNITHRHYFNLINDKLSFAYRLGYSGNLWGDEPYYAMPIMYSVMIKGATDEGLGGSRSLRGTRRNRVVGDGELYGNMELRWKFVKFKMFNQNFYLATNLFFDAGQAVQLLPLEDKINEIQTNIDNLDDTNTWGIYAIGAEYNDQGSIIQNGETIDDYFNFGAEKLHMSFGLGLKIAMNENFVVSVDYGKTLNEQDGPSGMYVGLNYAF